MSDFQRAKQIAYRYLSYRPRSQFEIINKLKDKNFSDSIIEQVIESFVLLDLINDEKFIKMWIQGRKRSGYGPFRIRRELQQKGIEKELLNQSLDYFFPQEQEEEVLEKIEDLISNRWGKIPHHLDIQKKRNRIYQYLIRRGFPTDKIMKVLLKYDGK